MGIAVRRVCVHTTALDSAAGAGRLRGSRWPGLRCGGAKSHKALTAVQRTNSKTDKTPCERKNHRANWQPKCRCVEEALNLVCSDAVRALGFDHAVRSFRVTIGIAYQQRINQRADKSSRRYTRPSESPTAIAQNCIHYMRYVVRHGQTKEPASFCAPVTLSRPPGALEWSD